MEHILLSELVKAALFCLRVTWRQVLAVHLVYTGLGVILFAPLLGVLGQLLLKLSGKPVLADMDLLFFALSPTGAFAIGLFAAVTVVISVFELASLMAIGIAEAGGKPMGAFGAVAFSLRRVVQIFLFAGRLVVKLLITAAPFLLGSAAVAFYLLSTHDINYYLAVQPLEFWVASVIIGILVAIMSVFLIIRLISWSIALPLMLFAGTAPADSFSASAKLTQQSRRRILWTLITWLAITLPIGVVITLGVRLAGELLVPLFLDSVTALSILFGLLVTIFAVASVVATAVTAGLLALLLAAFAREFEPRVRESDLGSSTRSIPAPDRNTRRRMALAFIAVAGTAALTGAALLDDIRVADDVQIVAHRGASAAAPENTMAAVRRAVADGADWIEIDVQESADGVVVVVHDRDFMKLAGVDLRVSEATVDQLAEIDIGSWFAPEHAGERVPTLADVLAEVKGRSRLIVELKYYGHDEQLEQRVIHLIEQARMQDDTMIMSLEYAGIQKVRALRPNWNVGLLSARAVGDLTRLDADFFAVSLALASPALVRAAHGAGKEIFVWTVNDALSMSQLMSMGIDGIITDEPRLGREVLTTRAELSSVQRLLLHVAPLLGIDAPSLNLESNDAESDNTNINLELSLHQRLQDRLSAPGSVLAEFTTDGCSGGLSVGWDYFAEQVGFFRDRHGKRPPWENCCVAHDHAYHVGGGPGLTPAQGYAARLKADDELRACVVKTATDRRGQLRAEYGLDDDQVVVLYEQIADSMNLAIRLGGMPCTGLSWRWGYGWPGCD